LLCWTLCLCGVCFGEGDLRLCSVDGDELGKAHPYKIFRYFFECWCCWAGDGDKSNIWRNFGLRMDKAKFKKKLLLILSKSIHSQQIEHVMQLFFFNLKANFI
jgi:hypothetical protein